MTVAGEVASRLEPIVAEAVAATGFDLDSLDVQQAGRRKLVKVVVDGDDGVGLDEVATISRAVSAVLDQHDELVAGAFTLEVTSPGVDRPLVTPRHWRRARYRLVRVTPVEGPAFVGRAGAAGEDSVRMLVDGSMRDVPYSGVTKAVIEIEFRQPPVEELTLLDNNTQDRAGRDQEESR